MATKIVIDKKRFDELFDKYLDKLKLHNFETNKADPNYQGSMHRKFHYEVCNLKREIEES